MRAKSTPTGTSCRLKALATTGAEATPPMLAVEATAMLDGTKRVGRDAQAHVLVQRFRDQRHVDKVRQEATLGLVVGVADIVAGHDGLAGQFAGTGHLVYLRVFNGHNAAHRNMARSRL